MIGAVLSVLLLAGIAYASIPDGSGVIHGCYMNSTGRLKVIDSASEACGSGETGLNWNQTGPAGPAGPAGLAGATGDTGPQGPSGFTGYQIITQSAVALEPGFPNLAQGRTMGAPIGKVIISGGYYYDQGSPINPPAVDLAWSYTADGHTYNWGFVYTGSASPVIQLYIIVANAP